MTSDNPLHGRPTVVELVVAVAAFLETEVCAATRGELLLDVARAAQVLRIVERELLDTGGAPASAVLADLGFADEGQLAAAIRNGDLDENVAQVTSCLRTLVRRRLAVANPKYQMSNPMSGTRAGDGEEDDDTAQP